MSGPFPSCRGSQALLSGLTVTQDEHVALKRARCTDRDAKKGSGLLGGPRCCIRHVSTYAANSRQCGSSSSSKHTSVSVATCPAPAPAPAPPSAASRGSLSASCRISSLARKHDTTEKTAKRARHSRYRSAACSAPPASAPASASAGAAPPSASAGSARRLACSRCSTMTWRSVRSAPSSRKASCVVLRLQAKTRARHSPR